MTKRLAIVDEAAATNPWPADTQYRRIIHVSGRGYGKTAAQQEMLAQHRLYTAPAGTTFIQEELEAQWEKLAGTRWRSRVFGHFDYTPRDELLDRLNAGLIGKTQAPVINTRYWRNQ